MNTKVSADFDIFMSPGKPKPAAEKKETGFEIASPVGYKGMTGELGGTF